MKYPAKGSSGDFQPVAAGTYTAVCDIVADIGLQEGTTLYPKSRRQVYLRFELPAERVEFEKDGKKSEGPAVIGKMYTASMHEKATLRAHIESWRGKAFTDDEAGDFDVASVLGKTCVVSVTHSSKDGKTYANITAIGKAMKGTEKLPAEIGPILYDEAHTSQYQQLPEWLRKKIDEQIPPEKPAPSPDVAPDYDAPAGHAYDGTEISDDDIPF